MKKSKFATVAQRDIIKFVCEDYIEVIKGMYGSSGRQLVETFLVSRWGEDFNVSNSETLKEIENALLNLKRIYKNRYNLERIMLQTGKFVPSKRIIRKIILGLFDEI